MIRCLTFAVLLLSSVPAEAADLTGLWLTQGHEAVMRVSPCGGGMCVAIAGVILDHPGDPTPVDYRGASQCHLKLVSDAMPVGPNLWRGHILDPRNGRVYGVELRLDSRGNLALRGFLGVPMLGATEIWTRYPGDVPDDCRLSAATVQAATLPPVPERPR
jgi:uncharacterized protein (DUF2147 family)